MQLSASTASPDTNLAALLMPGDAPPAPAGATIAGEGMGVFAQLFPDLASAATPSEKKSAAPAADGTPEPALPWTNATPSPANAADRTGAGLSILTAFADEFSSASVSGAPTAGAPTTDTADSGPGRAFHLSLGDRRPEVGLVQANDALVASAALPPVPSSAVDVVPSPVVGGNPAPLGGKKTPAPGTPHSSGKNRANILVPQADAALAPAPGVTPLASASVANGVDVPGASVAPGGATRPRSDAPASESIVVPGPMTAGLASSLSVPDRAMPVGESRPRLTASAARSLPPVPMAQVAADFAPPAGAALPGAVLPDAAAIAANGVPPTSSAHPVLAGEIASRYLAPTPFQPSSLAAPPASNLPSAPAGDPGTPKTAVAPEQVVADIVAPFAPPPGAAGAAKNASVPTAIAPTLDFTPPSRAETSLGGRGEKFAAAEEKTGGAKNSVGNAPDKTFLSVSGKQVVSGVPDIGTDVAKSSAAMSAVTFSNHPATAAVLGHVPAPDATTALVNFPSAAASQPAGDTAATAHRAVEAVLTAAERFSAGDHHAVNLQFSVGGADLTVRVEMRADEVRTMFRTDSPELRAALAQEWQTVNPGADRSLRLTTPVFASTDPANLAAFSGDSAPRQRESGARTTADDSSTFATVRAARATRSAPPALAEPTSRPALSPTMLHLHALA